jgi:hypothetical protein
MVPVAWMNVDISPLRTFMTLTPAGRTFSFCFSELLELQA